MSSTRPIALYTDIAELHPRLGIAALESAGWEVRVARSSDPDVIAEVGSDAEALLICYSPVTRELLERLPHLRIVATQSVGVDMVDLEACAERGVTVTNVPASATEEVATHALAMALSLIRGLPMFDRATKGGVWDANAVPGLARASTLTVGVLGLGRIGRKFADIAAPIFGEVVGYDPIPFDTPLIRRASLEEVLSSSDVLSLHLPLTPETHHLLDRDRLALLPKGARIVNVSRGALIDSEALLDALNTGCIGSAALDVFEQEPPEPNDPLLQHPAVVASPHIAFSSPESAREYILHQAENVILMGREGRTLSPLGLVASGTTSAKY